MAQIQNADELRKVYLSVFDGFAVVPSDIVQEHKGINSRFARELLGVLVHHGLVANAEIEGEDVWQTSPDTYDNITREQAEARIDEFLGLNQKKDTTMTTKAPTEMHDCFCGCKEKVPAKSFYRPGHDARHAGVVGRDIAANYTTKGYDRRVALDALPSDRLKDKAELIAEKAIERAEAKTAREQAKADKKANHTEEGTVKVGKKEYAATRDTNTGEVVYYDGDEVKAASKAATKTFTA